MNDVDVTFDAIDVDTNHFNELYTGINDIYSRQYYSTDEFHSINKKESDLKILHFNIRSLSRHFDELFVLLKVMESEFDVLCVTESWLHDSTQVLYGIPGYSVHHSLRPNNKRGGGITVFVSERYSAKLLKEQTTSSYCIESLFISVTHLTSKRSFIIY